jgi:beta-aspartyl-peptidase (threonine type)
MTAEEAVRRQVAELGERLAAMGGVIAVDRAGRWGWARSTATMSWAMVDGAGEDGGV